MHRYFVFFRVGSVSNIAKLDKSKKKKKYDAFKNTSNIHRQTQATYTGKHKHLMLACVISFVYAFTHSHVACFNDYQTTTSIEKGKVNRYFLSFENKRNEKGSSAAVPLLSGI